MVSISNLSCLSGVKQKGTVRQEKSAIKKNRRQKSGKMTIGKNSRKSSVRSSLRAPKFLDKSTGFYGRLDEPEVIGEGEEVSGKEVGERWDGTEDGSRDGGVVEKAEAFDSSEGMMGDDGEILLQRKPIRRSSRWRRSTRRKQKEDRDEEDDSWDERPSVGTDMPVTDPSLEVDQVVIKVEMGKEDEQAGGVKESALVHFAVREDEDDQVLIRDKKRGRDEEGDEERKMKKEQEEGMKMLKRNTVKNYRKVGKNRQFRLCHCYKD